MHAATGSILGTVLAMSALAAPMPVDRLDQIFSGPQPDTHWSCAVVDATTGEALYTHQQDLALAPASNQKLLTAAVALRRLGPDYAPATTVYADGNIADGRLTGNLVFSGQGAIHFSSRHRNLDIADMGTQLDQQLAALTQALTECGIREIQGKLLADSSAWGTTAYPAYPAASALLFQENTVDVVVKDRVPHFCPPNPYGFALRQAFFDGAQRRPRLNLDGSDVIEYNPDQDSVDYWRLERGDPDQRYLTQIQAGLGRHGITVRGIRLAPGTRRPLLSLPGLPVKELLPPILTSSDNLRAEILFRSIGFVHSGNADAGPAAAAVKAVAAEIGLDGDHVAVLDGSGLDARNRMSARDIVTLLRFLYGSPHWPLIRDAMAIAGERGTLTNVLKDPRLKGRIYGKTGTISGTKCLSGILIPEQGQPLIFSFMSSHPANAAIMWHIFEDALLAIAIARAEP